MFWIILKFSLFDYISHSSNCSSFTGYSCDMGLSGNDGSNNGLAMSKIFSVLLLIELSTLSHVFGRKQYDPLFFLELIPISHHASERKPQNFCYWYQLVVFSVSWLSNLQSPSLFGLVTGNITWARTRIAVVINQTIFPLYHLFTIEANFSCEYCFCYTGVLHLPL